MAWTYTTGILTSTGGTEALPDSLLAGIAIVQLADATRGYRNNNEAWLNNVEVRATGSFIRIDPDAQIELLGSSFINPGTGGVMHDYRSTLIISTTTSRADGALDFETGSTLLARRQRPNDPNPRIVYNTATRHDYPTILSGSTPSKVIIDGIDFYGNLAGGGSLKVYFGRATTNIVANVRFFNLASGQYYGTTYNDGYVESLFLPSETIVNTIVFNRQVFYRSTATSFGSALRAAQITLNNPTFLNNCWNGAVAFSASGLDALSSFSIRYSYLNFFKSGLTPIQGVNVQLKRARQSVTGSPTWTVTNSVINATSDSNGTYVANNLIDTYREGTSTTDLERFNWSLKARKYDQRTASESLFTNRVLYQGSVNLSAGYSEEVQMLDVANLTLTEAEANALTGISLVASGKTGGVITLTTARTVSEAWHYYRAWISKNVNFNSEDTWTFDGTSLNTGNWTLSNVEFLMGGAVTTPIASANGAFSNLRINGDVVQNIPTDLTDVVITGTLVYNTDFDTIITITNTTINEVANIGTGIVTINRINSTIANYTDAEINFIDSTIAVIGADIITFHPTANDRDLNINASGTFSGSTAFKFGSTINGSLMSGTLYLRCVAGGIPFNINKAIVLGDNLVDLGTTAQLASLSAKIDLTAKETSLNIVNQGVQKASQFKPHKTNI